MTSAEKGSKGEHIATVLLQKKGYAILARQYRTRWGEIDIIAQKERYLVFVEVKTRSLGSIAAPREWVNETKRRRLIQTASLYCMEHPSDLQPRFDVVEVLLTDGKPLARHIENAFDAGDAFGSAWERGTV
nr:YraN family protein [uncultured Solibaculum sp.]